MVIQEIIKACLMASPDDHHSPAPPPIQNPNISITMCLGVGDVGQSLLVFVSLIYSFYACANLAVYPYPVEDTQN